MASRQSLFFRHLCAIVIQNNEKWRIGRSEDTEEREYEKKNLPKHPAATEFRALMARATSMVL